MTPADQSNYVLRLADTALIASQRLCEWVGHAPELEEELALANIGLDLLGQARQLLSHAGSLLSPTLDEDALAMTRDAAQFCNLRLTEQPNGDFAQTITRQLFVSAWQQLLYQHLQQSTDTQLAAIAKTSLAEVAGHWRYASNWFIRLGDGTLESRERCQRAANLLWPYTGELFTPDGLDEAAQAEGIGPDLASLQPLWLANIATVMNESTVFLPTGSTQSRFGKQGHHDVQLEQVLADLQHLPRQFENTQW